MNKKQALEQLDKMSEQIEQIKDYVGSIPAQEVDSSSNRKAIIVRSKEAIRSIIMEKSELIKKDPAHHTDDYYC